ncbi:MAG: PAS domain S-box protein [Chloroflexota bacterium]
MTRTTRQTILHYAAAPAVVLLILLFKVLISEFIADQQAFLLFVAGIAFATWYGGIGPGLLSAALSALVANIFFMLPYGSLNPEPRALFQIVLFFLETLTVVGLIAVLRERPSGTLPAQQPTPNTQNSALALLETFQVYAPVGLAFLDNDLRYIRINYAMAEANGLTPAAHIGKLLKEIQPELTPEMIAEIQQVAITGKPLLDQKLVVNKPTMIGMKQQHFLTSYYRIRGDDGQSLGIGAVMVDMTQYVESEAALRESEARFRTMADTAPVMIWMSDPDQNGTYYNRQWLEFTGRSLEQEIGNGWLSSVHPDDLQHFTQHYTNAFARHREYETEYRLRRHDGEYRWILDYGVPRYTPDGEYVGYVGSSIDITERKQREIGEQFLMQAGIMLASSLDYKTTLANVARLAVPTIADWCAVDMLTPEGGVKRLAVAHIDPEKVKWAYELQERFPVNMNAPTGLPNVLRTGKAEFIPEVTEEMIEGAATDGETYEILRQIGFTSIIITPLIARGRTLGALTLVTTESRRHFTDADVTLAEQLATRAALAVDNASLYSQAQRERERFRITLTSVGDAVIATDSAGDVTFINHVAEILTGWQASEALGKSLGSIFKIVNEYTRETVENPVEKVLREGRIVDLANHTVLISKSGSEIAIEDSGAPIPDEAGNIGGVVLVFRDVSERKRAEQRQQFLGEATKLLISSLDYTTTLQHITRLAVPALADSAAIYLLDENGKAQNAAMHLVDPEVLERRQELVSKYSPQPEVSFGYLKVIRTGESELLPEVSDEILQSAATNQEHLEMLRNLNYQSSLCVPLRNLEGVFGAFTLTTLKGGRTLNSEDLALVEELGRVVSLAIDNARLYRKAQGNSTTHQDGD